jgi:hypothetical protein
VYIREASPRSESINEGGSVASGTIKKGKGASGKSNGLCSYESKTETNDMLVIMFQKSFTIETPPVRTPSASSDSGNNTDEEKIIRDDYVYPSSLKAWKQKKDKDMQELDQQPMSKTKRPTSSARGTKGKSSRVSPVKVATPRVKSPKRSKSPKQQDTVISSEVSTVSQNE